MTFQLADNLPQLADLHPDHRVGFHLLYLVSGSEGG
jgi:hypothetical protein